MQQTIGSLQKKYSIGSFELLSKTAPIQALSLLVLGPFIDYYLSDNSLLNYKMSSGAIVSTSHLLHHSSQFNYLHNFQLISCDGTYLQLFILLSCALAVFCNVSQYLCIGRFSAVSFQVLGHMKTVCVLTLGWLLFDSELTLKNISGMILAVVGMVIYSWAVEVEKQSSMKTNLNVKNSLTEEEIRLLKEGRESNPVKDIELGETKG